jgi:cytoskeletal protein RodZ
LSKIIRGVIGLIVVVVIAVTINNFYGEYKVASRAAARAAASSTDTSSTATTQTVVPVQGQHVAVLVGNLPLSSQAATGTKTVRVLKKGEQLLLVGVTANNWLQLRDAAGKLGYVANLSTNVKVQK